MNKRIVAVVAALLFISAAGLVTAQNVDTKIFEIESSVAFGYDVSTGSYGVGTSYGLNLTLTDHLMAGFIYTDYASTISDSNLLTLTYGLADKAGITLAVGKNATTTLVGVGMYYNIFERKVQDTLVSLLKVKVAYDFPPATGIDAGYLAMGLSLGLGL